MAIKVKIKDGTGTGFEAKVNERHALKVYQSIPGPYDENAVPYEFGRELLDNMNVDGSAITQSFTFDADSNYDIYLMKGILLISDGSIRQSKFGALSKLTNGIDIFVNRNGIDTHLIQNAKTNAECFIQSGAGEAIGAGRTVNIITNFSGSDDVYIVSLPFRKFFPEDRGMRLRRGSVDKLQVNVKDDLTRLVNMQLYIFYYKHIGGI